MHDVEIEVVDAPVGELLAADGLNVLAFVEGVPELGDDEEIGSLDESVGDGALHTLAGFDFVAVVLSFVSFFSFLSFLYFNVGDIVCRLTYRTRRQTDGTPP